MTDNEKRTKQMAKEIFNSCAWRFGKPEDYIEVCNDIAEDLTKLKYRKIPKDSAYGDAFYVNLKEILLDLDLIKE